MPSEHGFLLRPQIFNSGTGNKPGNGVFPFPHIHQYLKGHTTVKKEVKG